ncbi:Uncharacterised protein [Mycobacteroides abscessus subsp. massiliense]|nr:Uncharacterised protein [Mycobacteroides abscessus subsp. massiliense]SKZ09088.1 Uncharacterised protein [Mycobacteroides abscessus subsp. massiliense]
MGTYEYGAKLEQKCIEPGHWLIEGYDVWREDAWAYSDTVWHIEQFGKRVATCISLADARDSIRNRIFNT